MVTGRLKSQAMRSIMGISIVSLSTGAMGVASVYQHGRLEEYKIARQGYSVLRSGNQSRHIPSDTHVPLVEMSL